MVYYRTFRDIFLTTKYLLIDLLWCKHFVLFSVFCFVYYFQQKADTNFFFIQSP